MKKSRYFANYFASLTNARALTRSDFNCFVTIIKHPLHNVCRQVQALVKLRRNLYGIRDLEILSTELVQKCSIWHE